MICKVNKELKGDIKKMKRICSFVKKPVSIGKTSQGFIVDKTKAKLGTKLYFVDVYEVDDFIDLVRIQNEVKNGI